MNPIHIWPIFFSLVLFACQNKGNQIELKSSETLFAFPDSLDAVKVAPKSHIVLLENDDVRVLRVLIAPGEKEPMHTHHWKSVMYVEQPARIRYYNEKDEIAFQSSNAQSIEGPLDPSWMEPEGVHAVENIDTIDFVALRVELKK